jgi:beta-phosphoglucomutase-like phosphatase (HAD superfamily)
MVAGRKALFRCGCAAGGWEGVNGGLIMRTKTAQCVLDDLDQAVAAVIFGVDGVIVDTTRASAAAWKSVLDPFLRSYAQVHRTAYVPFDVRADYLRYMRRRPQLDGVRDFLASRAITLPYDDLRALAVRHEEFFLGEVRKHGVSPVASTVSLVLKLHRYGASTAAVSEQCCGSELLRRVGVAEMFDVLLDGLDTPGTALPARPDVRLFQEAALRLGTSPRRTAVIEASPSSVAAARCGGFGAVIGVDPAGGASRLGEHGADLVIANTSELPLHERRVA